MTLATGALCVLPLVAILAARGARLRRGLDARAWKLLVRRSASFAAASLSVALLLVWQRGSLAAPALWEALAALVTALLLAGSLLGRRDR